MFRKENTHAFSLLWLMVSIGSGYAFGQFLAPGETLVAADFLWEDPRTIPCFNWRAFLTGFCAVQSVAVVVHLVHRQWLWAAVEAALILLYGWLGARLSGGVLTGLEEGSDVLGFISVETTTFRTDLLLLLAVVLWGPVSVLRLMAEPRGGGMSGSLRLGLLLVAWLSTGAYFIGIHAPAFHSVKFWLFEDDLSLVRSIQAFFESNETFIGVVVLTFTLIFPLVKLAYMFWALLSYPSEWSRRINNVLSILGKYSMLDVFVLALLLLNLKFDSRIIDMELRDGVIWFAISILLNMAVTSFLVFRKRGKARE